MVSLPKIIVVGASGYIGKATLASLVYRHGHELEIHAGVRNPSKFGEMDGVTVTKADMGDKQALVETLKQGYSRVFLVIPGHEDRTQLGLNGLEAAKEAGIKHILLLSVLTADTDTIFGRQFKPLEQKVKQLGIVYTIVRLPLFIDNNYAHVESIKGQGTFYTPQDPTKLHTPVAVSDVGKAAADIIASPQKHIRKTYKLLAPAFSLNDQASAFTKALQKQVTPTVVPYEAAKQAFMGMGFPEWQTDGILELYKLIDSGSSITNEVATGDIEKITGEKATTAEEWSKQNAPGFGFIGPPKTLVVGASGYVGKATLSSLVSRHGSEVEIHAGVRNPSKFGQMEGVTVVKADMGSKAALVKTLKDGGYASVFLVIPGHADRTQLGINGLEAVKEAGIKHVLLLSVLTAETDTIFGRQFKPLEDKVKELGIAYTIVRLPLFIDNSFAHVGSIQEQNTFYVPQDPTKKHTPVAVGDVGKAAADILTNPTDHNGKVYKLVAPAFSLNDQASAFTKALRTKKVTPTVVPYDAAKKAFMGMGFPEWQTDGILELYKLIDAGSHITNETHTSDIEMITGEKPTTVEEWTKQSAPQFLVSAGA